jgi:hypothetical protein
MLRAPIALVVLAAAAPTLAGCGQLSIFPDLAPYLGRSWQAFEQAHPNACGQPFAGKDGGQHVACVTDAYSVIFDIDAAGIIRAYQGAPR